MRMKDQVAIITGVSHAGQVGFALSAAFAREDALGPGLIVTQSNVDSMKPTAEDIRNKWVSLENIVEAAIFLVTPAGDGVNGVVLPIQAKGI